MTLYGERKQMSINEMEVENVENEQVEDVNPTAEATEEQQPETEPAVSEVTEEPKTDVSINWAEYGLPQFAGRNIEEVASYTKNFFKRYGDQANELGELRKLKEKFSKVEETVSGKEQQKELAKLNDVEYKMFADMFIDNPLEALNKFAMPHLKEALKAELKAEMQNEIAPQLQGFAQNLTRDQSFNQFARSNPDWTQHRELMDTLMAEEHLGENHEFDDVYQLSKLYKTDSALAAECYQLMKRGVSYPQAKRYASAVLSTPVAKSNIKEEVSRAKMVSKPSGVKAVNTGKNINTWDDVLEETLKDIGVSQ
jgi:hypothetical protein